MLLSQLYGSYRPVLRCRIDDATNAHWRRSELYESEISLKTEEGLPTHCSGKRFCKFSWWKANEYCVSQYGTRVIGGRNQVSEDETTSVHVLPKTSRAILENCGISRAAMKCFIDKYPKQGIPFEVAIPNARHVKN